MVSSFSIRKTKQKNMLRLDVFTVRKVLQNLPKYVLRVVCVVSGEWKTICKIQLDISLSLCVFLALNDGVELHKQNHDRKDRERFALLLLFFVVFGFNGNLIWDWHTMIFVWIGISLFFNHNTGHFNCFERSLFTFNTIEKPPATWHLTKEILPLACPRKLVNG